MIITLESLSFLHVDELSTSSSRDAVRKKFAERIVLSKTLTKREQLSGGVQKALPENST